ncbi:Conserved hypothetical protein [gamma proteobacterium HdN1]|nr:Conserved hypothetical protein [gamma proteobacterium HdN1]
MQCLIRFSRLIVRRNAMSVTDAAQDHVKLVHSKPQVEWPAPLTAKEWDERFPGSLDAVAVAAAGANVIMQLALPAVGYGVKESKVSSGALFHHPIKRARTTFTYLAVALLGNTDEKRAYRSAVSRVHRQVASTSNSPVRYSALNADLQLWVAACLFWGVLDMLEKFRGGVPPEKTRELMTLCQPLATTLQVRPEQWPEDVADFKAYWNGEIEKLKIDPVIRGFLTEIIELKFMPKPISLTLGPLYRFITSGFLPPQIRREMGISWSRAHQLAFDTLIKSVALINNPLPRVVRQLPVQVVWWDFQRRIKSGKPLV